MLSKKANWVGFILHPTFETAIALAVVLLYLLWYINGIGQATGFEKKFLATDIPLAIDSILAMPQDGNLYAMYLPQRSSKFQTNYSYIFTKNSVKVTLGDKDARAVTGYYTSDPSISIQEKTFVYKDRMIFPVFIKQGNNILIDNQNAREIDYNRNIIACNGPNTAPKLAVSGEGEAAQIAQRVKGFDWAVDSGGQGSFGIILSQGEKTIIKAYVDANQQPDSLAKSERIACEAANSVALALDKAGIDVSGVAVIPINPKQTSRKEDDSLAGFGVLLELQTPENLADKQQSIALAIGDGVKNAQS